MIVANCSVVTYIHDPAERLDKEIGAPCYPVCVDTNVDCVKIHRLQLCMFHMWCPFNICGNVAMTADVLDEDRNGHLSTCNTFVTDISEIMQADACYWSS